MKATVLESKSLLDDVNLIERFLSGDEDGFEELVNRYHRPLVSYIHKMVDDYETALDLTQEVFIKVYNFAEQYSSKYKFSTWIYKIAHNTAVDYLRRRISEKSLDDEQSEFQAIPKNKSLSPEQESLTREWLIQVESVIRCLPTSYRELIILRHQQELSYEEIAKITGLPLGTVKNRLFRAREMMKQMLSERGFI
ncbi:MAG: sigma-70 family RNA polymerase sigma factor [Pyrinomonadaceae bacterium]|nr:sigma-70 family RNA polymerase sigma factor [Pyrinomonadaceae bacterium]MCX7640562.1 sigma-70 family RNA polymerase sigma factor [Pyrinomonadaceae bacterium]MDW8303857.1 sigma-70 family RNA polymerase sigma factor [Acidobacteriota bacterium]